MTKIANYIFSTSSFFICSTGGMSSNTLLIISCLSISHFSFQHFSKFSSSSSDIAVLIIVVGSPPDLVTVFSSLSWLQDPQLPLLQLRLCTCVCVTTPSSSVMCHSCFSVKIHPSTNFECSIVLRFSTFS